MNRIILFFSAMLLIGSSLTAQTSKRVNYATLQKKIEKSDAKIAHEKHGQNYKTWISRGELMLEVYDAMTLSAKLGMTINEFKIIVGTPKQESEKEVEDQTILEFQMDRVNFYFINGQIEYWLFTNPIIENPLTEAYNSFKKAQELDVQGKTSKKLTENFTKLKFFYITEGTGLYTQKKYIESAKNFVTSVEIAESPLVSSIDTIIVYYAGLAAQVGGDYENAVKYYKKALDLNYTAEGNIYYNIFEAYSKLGKDAEGVDYLKNGFLKYPKNQSVLYGLINYYITKGEDPKIVLDYIHKAMETNAIEPSLHFAEGTLYDKLEDFEQAVKSYEKAIELKPDFFDAIYNLGAIYFNNGVKHIEEANKIPAREIEKYDRAIEKANLEFKLSIPYMEKAYEITPDSKAVIETLRNLYFRFRTEGEEIQLKYEKMNDVFKNLQE